MKNEITTLEQAGKMLIENGVVDFNTMTVEGKQLLDVCGFSLSNPRAEIKRQIEKHALVEGNDFIRSEDATHKGRGQKPVIYIFTMNAANHILLAAMTQKGKEARQEAIDLKTGTQSFTLSELSDIINQAAQAASNQTAVLLENKFMDVIKAKNDLIHKKSEPLSLSKIYGGSSKVVQAANLYLEELGYQTLFIKGGKRSGWTISDEGRELGSQVSDGQIRWVPEVKEILPKTSELLSYAERLNLTDHKA